MEQTATPRVLRLPEVIKITGLSRSTIYAWVNSGRFPPPVHLGRTVGWLESEVADWLRQRVAERPSSANATGEVGEGAA